MTFLRVTLFGLLLLLLGQKSVFGEDLIGGGDGGIIILPSAVAVTNFGSLEEPRQTVSVPFAYGDLTLQLPDNMGASIAILSLPGEDTSTILAIKHGRLYFAGDDLQIIRDSGIESFRVTIVSAFGLALKVSYKFESDHTATLIVL